MKVLITGGEGQLGRALLSTAPAGIEIVALSRRDLDITEPMAVRRAIENFAPDATINTAAYTAVDRAESDAKQAFAVNDAAVALLAEACAAQGTRLIHISTDFVFDGDQSHPYRPDDAPAPLGIYGRSKHAGEGAALSGPRNLVVRTAWVYAARGQNFVETMLRLMQERDELRIVADQTGTPTHAVSLARATWSLCEFGTSGICHFTDAGIASWYDFAVAIQEEALALGLLDRAIPVLPIATSEYPTPANRPAYSVLDKSECWAILGQPARHWRAELRDMLKARKEPHG